jgi:hypothetical protein
LGAKQADSVSTGDQLVHNEVPHFVGARARARCTLASGYCSLYVNITNLVHHSPAYSSHSADTFPSLIVNGQTTPEWVNVRRTNNYNTQAPVTDVTSADFRCYDSQTDAANTATTVQVAAGSLLGIASDGTIYHPGVSTSPS